jgi:hypothetical protein
MVHNLLRGGTVAAAVAAAIGLASTLAACASTASTVNAGNGAAATASATAPASSPAASPSASASSSAGTVNPGGPAEPTGTASTAQAQAATLPSGAKYVAIDRMTKSSDGKKLYLSAEAQGGACGNFTVVVQESSAQVHVGLAKLPVKTGVMCPMYIAERTFTATLASPVGGRSVIDLADNSTLGP